MFEQAVLVGPRQHRRGTTFAVSMAAQVLVLGTALLIPLFLIEGPSAVKLHFLIKPPSPPSPPPVHIKLVEVPAGLMRRVFDGYRLFAPRHIPTTIATIVETDLPPADATPNVSGVPGAIRGYEGGVIGGFGQVQIAPPPAEAKPAQKAAEPAPAPAPQRIRTGGDVQAAMLINRVVPPYPQLAKAARIQGTVRLMGIISKDGHIIQLQVLSGHPLLVTAAVDAVKQWVYRPTLLNTQPVEVIAPIDVHFTLGN